MYTAFYGLREKPFALSPDPRFLYLAGSHREALAHLLYGIEQGEGFIAVTGEVGTGKTTLCRTLLERLEGHTELAFLFNPSRSALELMQSICAELGLPAEGLARRALMSQLNDHLLEQRRRGRRVLLIIDEAQTLTENTLEQVRLLSNLETSREKLIQILLLGQPELDRKLDQRSLRQLRQRISVRWKLEPLGPQETRAYVRHRLAIAAGEPRDLFSEAALREIHRRTAGIPRLVNQLCDRALLAGYAARAAQIGPALVRNAAREIPDAARRRGRAAEPRPRRPWLFFAMTLVLVLLALVGGRRVGRSGLESWLRGVRELPPVAAMGPAIAPAVGAAVGSPGGSDAGVPRSPGGSPRGLDGSASELGDRAGSPLNRSESSARGIEPAASLPLARLIGAVPPAEWTAGSTGDPGAREGSSRAAEAQPSAARAAEKTSALDPESGPAAAVLRAGATPEWIALAPGLLRRVLDGRRPPDALAESHRILLGRFGRRVPSSGSSPRDLESLRSSIEGRGLVATPFDGGSLALLRVLDHPVLLALDPTRSDGRSSRAADAAVGEGGDPSTTRWVAITGFEGDRATVAGLLPGRTASVPVEELEDLWLETGILVWERFERVPPLLAQGDEGRGVLWLQRALAELRVLRDPPTGLFDATTRDAVRSFQRERGLVADGIAGPLTQIALYARLDRYPVPRLSKAATRATGMEGDSLVGGLQTEPSGSQEADRG